MKKKKCETFNMAELTHVRANEVKDARAVGVQMMYLLSVFQQFVPIQKSPAEILCVDIAAQYCRMAEFHCSCIRQLKALTTLYIETVWTVYTAGDREASKRPHQQQSLRTEASCAGSL